MSKINSGILQNAEPLTEEQEGALQKEVLADQKAFAYLNSNKELCFALPNSPECIKELAWDHAQHWYLNGTQIRMNEYRRNGVGAYYLDQCYYCAAPDSVVATMPKIPLHPTPSSYGLTLTGSQITGYSANSLPESGILYIPAHVDDVKLTHIASEAFTSCYKLRYVNIPPTITKIEGNAFANCANLVEIDLGGCEADITPFAFVAVGGATALNTFSVGATNKKYSAIDGVLFDAEKTTLIFCPPCRTEYACPDGTLSIAYCAFLYSKLTSVVIPTSVTHIASNAFAYLNSTLTTITYLGTKQQWENIIKQKNWCDTTTHIKYVQCSDGTITL